jgi:ribosome assembly protein YihI (activator of Der GTPase)
VRRQAASLHAQTASTTLDEAKSRFVETITDGVNELMQRCGYSRERATCALLREIGRGDAPPNDDQVRKSENDCFLEE